MSGEITRLREDGLVVYAGVNNKSNHIRHNTIPKFTDPDPGLLDVSYY